MRLKDVLDHLYVLLPVLDGAKHYYIGDAEREKLIRHGRDWLERHRPGFAAHVMGKVQAMRGGQDNDPRFGTRMRGEGAFADLLAQRFALARKRLGLERRDFVLDCSQFAPPGRQLALL